MSRLTELEKAVLDLKSRERCRIDSIGCLPRGATAWSSETPGLEGRIQDWVTSKRNEVEAVIWTNLDWKLPGAPSFNVESGMNWLRGLRAANKDGSAEEYIRRAPSQTDTCLRRQAREEFGWLDISIGY